MNNRRKQYPVKTSVNLLCKENKNISPVHMLIAASVFVIVLVLFSKFAVIDRLAAAGEAMQEAEDMENAVADLKQENSDYEDVLREYQHYYFSAADNENGETENYVDCQKVLGLLETELLNKAGVQTVDLTGNVLTVNLTEINLERASAIARSLKENEMVEDVMVSAANRQQESEGTTVYLSIILKTEEGGITGQNTDTEEDE